MVVIDTHALIWLAAGSSQLGKRAKAMIGKHWDAGNAAVSAITFWEAAMLVAQDRVKLPPVDQWRTSRIESGLKEIALDGEIAVRAAGLGLVPADPADRFIVATALLSNATLVTADARLLAWPGALKRLDARS